MKNVFKVVKKELDKIFRFPRMIFTTILLPGLILFAIYSFIGSGFQSIVHSEDDMEVNIIHVINSPESLDFIYSDNKDLKVELVKATESELENLKQGILNGTVEAVIYYDKEFDQKIANKEIPNVEVFFNSTEPNSSMSSNKANTIINLQQAQIYEDLGINPNIFTVVPTRIEEESKGSAMILAMILPMLIMSFIFASALGIGSDAIAGEKERGTLATLLMLPVKRSEIIIGKIVSTSTLTILSALSSFIGLAASLPFSKDMFAIDGPVNYGAGEIVGLILMLLLIALFASTLLLIISTLAKNVKEATTMAMPIYIAAIITPFISMFTGGDTSSKVRYFIPIFNTILGLREILSLDFNFVNFIIIFGSSIVYIGLFMLFLIRLFKSERVLYSK